MDCMDSGDRQFTETSCFVSPREIWANHGAGRPPASSPLFVFGVCVLLFVSGCASGKEDARNNVRTQAATGRIAVFPVENLSGKLAPLGAIRALLIEKLKSQGISVLDDETLDKVVTKHRIRYTAGVEQGIAKAIREEAGAEAILVPSLELYDEANPPKVAIFCRLVATGDNPAVVWIDGTGMAGDDSPGILGLGLIEDPRVLLTNAVESLTKSLAEFSSEASEGRTRRRVAGKFRPKIVYRSDVVDPGKEYSIAVMPFFNKSARKYAGEIIALHMIRNLMSFQNFVIVEPGIVREELLRFRIIMSDGVSLPDTETILNAVNADLVLNGEVLDYQDYQGSYGSPKVDFSVLFIERRTRRVVYSSYSQNQGDDGVVFFDLGRVNTAHAMAAQMARAIGERMLLEGEKSQARRDSARQRSTTRQ